MKILTIIFTGVAAVLLSTGAGAQVRSNALVITSPSSGTVVAPGQTISVSVTVNSGTYPGGIGIVGGQDGGTMVIAGPLSGSSLTFSVTIPTDAAPGPLGISATGADSSGNLDASTELTLDVERTDSPVSLRVDPPSFQFQQGQSLQLSVTGVYADGSWHGLTHSSNLQMTSSNTAVAVVQNGSIVGAGVGSADIQISYESLTATVPVVVTNAATGNATYQISISSGGLLELQPGVAAGQSVLFDDAGDDTLKLDQAQNFNGTLEGLAAASGTSFDTVDLANFKFAYTSITSVSGTGAAGTITAVTLSDSIDQLTTTLYLLNQHNGEYSASAGDYSLTSDRAWVPGTDFSVDYVMGTPNQGVGH